MIFEPGLHLPLALELHVFVTLESNQSLPLFITGVDGRGRIYMPSLLPGVCSHTCILLPLLALALHVGLLLWQVLSSKILLQACPHSATCASQGVTEAEQLLGPAMLCVTRTVPPSSL